MRDESRSPLLARSVASVVFVNCVVENDADVSHPAQRLGRQHEYPAVPLNIVPSCPGHSDDPAARLVAEKGREMPPRIIRFND